MIFLFGEEVLNKAPKEGQFHCPHCEQTRAYQHICQKNYFTLFFIPLLPLDTFKEYVECKVCGNSFHPSVLEQPEQLPAHHYALRRIMADIVRTTSINEAHLNLMCQCYQAATETELSKADAQAALQAARDDPRDLLDYIRHIGAGLNAQGIDTVVMMMAQFLAHLSGQWPLLHEHRVMLNQMATELGIGADDIKDVFRRLQQQLEKSSDT